MPGTWRNRLMKTQVNATRWREKRRKKIKKRCVYGSGTTAGLSVTAAAAEKLAKPPTTVFIIFFCWKQNNLLLQLQPPLSFYQWKSYTWLTCPPGPDLRYRMQMSTLSKKKKNSVVTNDQPIDKRRICKFKRLFKSKDVRIFFKNCNSGTIWNAALSLYLMCRR